MAVLSRSKGTLSFNYQRVIMEATSSFADNEEKTRKD